LTANLQLQPCRNPSRRARPGYPGRAWRELVAPRGPGGASIECSSALHLPTAVFSTARRACDVASDALCRGPREPTRPCGRTSSRKPPGAASAARLVKDAPLRRHQDAFPRRVLSPLRERLAPPAGSSTARHRAPGFAAVSRLRAPFRATEHEAGRLDPALPAADDRRGADLDQVPLVDFCNQFQSTSTTTGSTDPRPGFRRRGAPSLRWTGRRPPDGVEAIRPVDDRIRVVPPDVVRLVEPRGPGALPAGDLIRDR